MEIKPTNKRIVIQPLKAKTAVIDKVPLLEHVEYQPDYRRNVELGLVTTVGAPRYTDEKLNIAVKKGDKVLYYSVYLLRIHDKSYYMHFRTTFTHFFEYTIKKQCVDVHLLFFQLFSKK